MILVQKKITNLCAKGHSYTTRFSIASRVWWWRHEKCYDEVYGRSE